MQDGGTEWYYCDPQDGFLKTGWFQDGGSEWYYCYTADDAAQGHTVGVMASNAWVRDVDGRWFYLDENGVLVIDSWIQGSGETWYHVDSTGALETNKWINVGGIWYYLGADGAYDPDMIYEGEE